MNKKIFVHVGMNKTGSTSLQLAMHRAKGILSRNGVMYDGYDDETCQHTRVQTQFIARMRRG